MALSTVKRSAGQTRRQICLICVPRTYKYSCFDSVAWMMRGRFCESLLEFKPEFREHKSDTCLHNMSCNAVEKHASTLSQGFLWRQSNVIWINQRVPKSNQEPCILTFLCSCASRAGPMVWRADLVPFLINFWTIVSSICTGLEMQEWRLRQKPDAHKDV